MKKLLAAVVAGTFTFAVTPTVFAAKDDKKKEAKVEKRNKGEDKHKRTDGKHKSEGKSKDLLIIK